MKYKFLIEDGDYYRIVYTHDKIFADFMNKKLTFWQKFWLFLIFVGNKEK